MLFLLVNNHLRWILRVSRLGKEQNIPPDDRLQLVERVERAGSSQPHLNDDQLVN